VRGSVASEVEARVELYRRVFAFCRQGGFSFARFLALVPERLRLALGDHAQRIRVPVHVRDELRQRWRALLPPGERPARTSLYGTIPELKRLVRLAQVDPGVDVVCLAEWLRTSAEPLTELTRGVYARALAEVGRGEGGLETAYLVHHLVLDTLAGLSRASAPEQATARAALLHPLLELAISAAAESAAAAAVPARLGYQLAVTTSPWSLGAGAELIERHVNAYRTTREAVGLARRVVQEPLELIDLERVVGTLAERQLVDPAQHAGLRREVLLELVRDGLLLLVAQTWTPGSAPELELAHQVISSPRALEQHLFVTRRRAELSAWLTAHTGTHKAAAAVARLVDGAEQVLAGDLGPLGVQGDLRERALSAARGAVVLVLDQHTEALRRDVSALVEVVPAAEADEAWREGRAYRLGSGPEPLYTQRARAAEGYLLLDLSTLAARLAALPARASVEVVRRSLYDPIAAAVARASAGDPSRLSIARWTSDQIALTGDLVAIVELAVVVRAEVVAAGRALEAEVPEVLGGGSGREAELDAELARLGERLATVEGALLRFSEDPASARFLRDSHAVLSRELGALSQARRRALARAHPLEVGAFVAVAEPAVVVELPAATPGRPPLSVSMSRAHAEASACVGRGARVVASREALRRAGGPSSPFAVELERRIRVPVEVETRLHHALTTHDPQALAALAEAWAAEVEHTWDDELYNAGLALSGAALAAYAHDRRGVLVFDDRRVSPDDLPVELRRRFRLGQAPLELRAATRVTDGALVHLFRRVGELRPHQLEGDVEVWEHLALDGDFVRALEALAAEGG
jgi:hypothetical protein